MRRPRLLLIALVASAIAVNASAQLRTTVHASGFSLPIAFVQDPTDRTVQFVVEQGGRIRTVRNGAVLATDFLNVTASISSGGERGLLGLAFAPDYASSGRFFVNFTNPDGNTVVARFRRSANPLIADAGSRFDLRFGGAGGPAFIAQPFANHNGGNLAFGSDGFLYIGMGDGGAGNDPDHRAQNPMELLGKMLRIDVNVLDSDAIGYSVPADNPFASGSPPVVARPEIWSFGLRNPWRYSFDDMTRGGTGALVIGDVGQGAYEEIDYEPRNRGGRNYGWRNREGAHDNVDVMPLPPAYTPLVDPIYEYDHSVGSSITGGFVYRGRALGSAFIGRYFFADFIAKRVWSMALAIDPGTFEATPFNTVEHTTELGGTSVLGNISAFGVDADGELYVVSYSRGMVLKIVDGTVHVEATGAADFDGDQAADLSLFQPSTGMWSTLNSASDFMMSSTTPWGVGTDIPVPADYDGDGRSDVAVYRPSSGVWWVLQSSSGFSTFVTYHWGLSTDVPVPGDYDGDGRADIAVFRPSTGVWFILFSGGNYQTYVTYSWGVSSDAPVPADFDGDGKMDIAVFRKSTGVWWVLRSTSGFSTYVQYMLGTTGDVPVQADYDGDGRAEIAVFTPASGTWSILYSSGNYQIVRNIRWGVSTDIPVPADYDGDGNVDVAVYRASSGVWWVKPSYDDLNFAMYSWGTAADEPVFKRR
jgi:glucose/arabinose dehydrogenase